MTAFMSDTHTHTPCCRCNKTLTDIFHMFTPSALKTHRGIKHHFGLLHQSNNRITLNSTYKAAAQSHYSVWVTVSDLPRIKPWVWVCFSLVSLWMMDAEPLSHIITSHSHLLLISLSLHVVCGTTCKICPCNHAVPWGSAQRTHSLSGWGLNPQSSDRMNG